MQRVSLVLIAKNEEQNIKRCLESVKKSVDEMVVVDTGSTDKTKEIALECGAVVYDFLWTNHFAEARNFGLSKATGDWILSLDADEYFRKNYRQTIQNFIKKPSKIGRIKIISDYDDDGQRMESYAYMSRLFPKGIEYIGRIHEQLDSPLQRTNVQIEVLHSGYYKTDKTERNIRLLNEELKLTPQDAYYLYQLGKEYRNRKEYYRSAEILATSYRYAGRAHSYYPSLVIEYMSSLLKSNQLQNALEVIKAEEQNFMKHPDFHFIKGNILMNYHATNPNVTINELQMIEQSFLTCIRIGENSPFESMIGTGSFLPAYNLGLYYELLGEIKKAIFYYRMSSRSKYQPAMDRLRQLLNNFPTNV